VGLWLGPAVAGAMLVSNAASGQRARASMHSEKAPPLGGYAEAVGASLSRLGEFLRAGEYSRVPARQAVAAAT